MDAPSSNESGTTGLDLKTDYDRIAARSIIHQQNLSRCTRICIQGYDPSRSKHTISKELRKHFAQCGRVFDIKLAGDNGCDVVEGSGYIYFAENGAQKKALGLDGTDVERYGTDVPEWTVVVKAIPKFVCKFSPEYVAALRRRDFQYSRSTRLFVKGYDTSLPHDDVENALINCFSSCGVITSLHIGIDYPQTNVRTGSSVLSIFGEGSVEKALALSGTDLGGLDQTVAVNYKAFDNENKSPNFCMGTCNITCGGIGPD